MSKRHPVSWTGAMDVASVHGVCPHGSTYRKGCKCPVCLATVAQYMRNYRRRLAERSWGTTHPTTQVDPSKSVTVLRDAHKKRKITINEISRVTGLSKQTISDLLHDRRKLVTKSTEDVIIRCYGIEELTRRDFTDNQLVPFKDHAWKIYGLFAQGWTSKTLSQILRDAGRPHGFMSHLSELTNIRYSTTKQIDWLVETIGDRRGPSKNNPPNMARRGIFPLIHYSEDGKLLRGSLTEEQLAQWRRVR